MTGGPDENELAHRIVGEATETMKCPDCGKPMKKEIERIPMGGGIGTDEPNVFREEGYWVCPSGHVIRRTR
jgi:hypothetical protein